MAERTGQGKIGTASASHMRYAFWRSCLRHSATIRKVARSIPNGVVSIVHWHNPSGRTMTLGSTQPVTEMNTRGISRWCKGGRCVGLITLAPLCPECVEIPWTSTSWSPEGLFRPVRGLLYLWISHWEARRNAENRDMQCFAVLKIPCIKGATQSAFQNITWCVQVLRSPKEAFAAAMHSWRERCEKCVCLQGDYVEEWLHFQLPMVNSFF